MGLLYLGTPLSWEEGVKWAGHVRFHGVTQFLHIWDRCKDRDGDIPLWGDEVEYMVVVFDDEEKNAKLSLRQTDILAKLRLVVADMDTGCSAQKGPGPNFHPEYGRYMLESTPGSPYTDSIPDLFRVECDMRFRRNIARKHLKQNEVPITFTSFPRLGVPGVFADPHYDPVNAVSSHSLLLPEQITNPHARFPTLTANIRKRRGSKVAINLPLFIDRNTPRPFVDPTIPWQRAIYPEDPEARRGAALLDHIYLDAMGFGMGCCCLQVTWQACNIGQARRIYDALIPIAPILLALTAASPIWRGYLADVDCRWNVIAGSVDDRTEEERGLKPLKESRFRMPKSRYDSASMYISNERINKPEYNDSYLPYDPSIYSRLRDHGLDDLLSKHISHLFIRDPLVVFSETIDQDDANSNDHFENIQSTNWQSVRFKPPPPNSDIGWRVEFRTMEVQITDFENAAFAVFVMLLIRTILAFNLNFYTPISKVDENMARAQRRDAVLATKFFFRKDVTFHDPLPTLNCAVIHRCNGSKEATLTHLTPDSFAPINGVPRVNGTSHVSVHEEYEEMTMADIMDGNGDSFPGLLRLVYLYLDRLKMGQKDREKIEKYLDFIRRRSTGSLKTLAAWTRTFVRSHPAYQFDSAVSQEINYDLMVALDKIEQGVRREPTLLPEDYSCTEEVQSDAGAGI